MQQEQQLKRISKTSRSLDKNLQDKTFILVVLFLLSESEFEY